MSDADKTTILGVFHQDALPDGAKPVEDFDVQKYLGTWYEIARLNYYWEGASLINVTATYSAKDDGKVKVVNKGLDSENEKWTEYSGTASFRGDTHVGALSVSFFPGIHAGYNVLSIDGDYAYALVAGRNLDYIWFLSRTTSIPDDIKAKYLKMAHDIGYDVSKLIWVPQDINYALNNEKNELI